MHLFQVEVLFELIKGLITDLEGDSEDEVILTFNLWPVKLPRTFSIGAKMGGSSRLGNG